MLIIEELHIIHLAKIKKISHLKKERRLQINNNNLLDMIARIAPLLAAIFIPAANGSP